MAASKPTNKKPATRSAAPRSKRSAAQPAQSRRRAPEVAPLLDDGARHDLAGLIVTATGLVLFATLFTGEAGLIGTAVRWLRVVIGGSYYALPFVMLAWGVTFFVPSNRIHEFRIAVGLGIALAFLSGMLSLYGAEPTSWAVASLAESGGAVGHSLYWLLSQLSPGVVIPTIILITGMLAGLVVAGASYSEAAEWFVEKYYDWREGRVPAEDPVSSVSRGPKTRKRGSDSYAADVAGPEDGESTIAISRGDRPTVKSGSKRGDKDAVAASGDDRPAHDVSALGRPIAMEGFVLPPVSLLSVSPSVTAADSRENHRQYSEVAAVITETLGTFDVPSKVVDWVIGPTVTLFKIEIAKGTRLNKVTALADDLALALSAQTIRILAPIPGESLVGVEVPNTKRSSVTLGDVLPTAGTGSPLLLGIGKDVSGNSIAADLGKLPHLLIGGSTGSGKSVAINAMLISMIMRATPAEVRLILIDPKRVELALYNDIPHLYVPVVTEPGEAAAALAWAVGEMERRLRTFQKAKVRDIGAYNQLIQSPNKPEWAEQLPYLVIVIDELADLMMVAAKEVEGSIVRIAQLARAAGIHLIVATQRPEANVVTGLIKANITTRIAFRVATAIDSRVIIDQSGADKLTGLGDMLYSTPEWPKPKRIQGCFVSTEEISSIVEALKVQSQPDYHPEVLTTAVASTSRTGGGGGGDEDPLLWDAAEVVVSAGMGSTSTLQRRLSVGFARAGRIMDMLYERGIVGPSNGTKPREVLVNMNDLDEMRFGAATDDGDDDPWGS